MSELKERRWAVLSERGCEDAGLNYEEASGLVARLRGERISGLCVVTDAAAAHVPRAQRAAAKSAAGGDSKPKRGRKKGVR
jgi:ribosomal protein L12E/L44/L45/RPP1/RPP2